MLNNKRLITPQSSILAFALANKAALYFGVSNVNADQVAAYARSVKLSVQDTEKTLSAITGYIPSYIER